MKRINILYILLLAIIISSCSEDDGGGTTIELRDEAEVRDENALSIQDFLSTHFYRFESNPNFDPVVIDTIAGDNSNETPLINSEFLESKTVINNEVEYELFYLKFREGAISQRHPKFSDSTLVTYEGYTLERDIFDASPNPIWFDLTAVVRGFYEALPEFRGATDFELNPDGTGSFSDDFGVGAVFIPSGLGYFASPPVTSGIGAYDPIYFTFQMYRSKESDHDLDGVPNWREDVDSNRRLNDDDTDGDRAANYLDTDDDNDGVPTRDEIIIDEETGEVILPDTNGNGTPDYLDNTFAPEIES